MTCVKLFLEPKEKEEINKFSSEFQAAPTPDDKVITMIMIMIMIKYDSSP